MRERWVIGLMSGTSMDAVDVAAIRTDGRTITVQRGGNGHVAELGPTGNRPYAPAERALIARAKEDASGVGGRLDRPGCLPDAEALVTRAHAEAVERFLEAHGIAPADVEVIGFHGQTVLHRPEIRLTVQLGDGQALADRLGIPVVYDLRAADVDAGGQGAPLVPVFHRALALACDLEPPLAVLNIGGVANVTLIGPGDEMLAFDTGPGNALLDDLMSERGLGPCDRDGATAAKGTINGPILRWLLAHPFFDRAPPKSLDRDDFSHRLLGRRDTSDAAATLTAFTARAVARALDWTEWRPRRWIVGGGGARNPTLMAQLAAALGPDVDLSPADTLGWSGEYLEAQAFAFLAARSLAGLPLTYPTTTGVDRQLAGGKIANPSRSMSRS